MQFYTETNNSKSILHIGMMGLVVNNGNMGCVALTYSFITIMEELSKKLGNITFLYSIYEDNPDSKKILMMCNTLNLDIHRVHSVKYKKSLSLLHDINMCDLIFDFTEGDSFSDIYGNKRFYKTFLYKKIVLMCNKKLILGPQTIGPFVKKINEKLALNIIKKASLVFSRDRESIDYISNLSNANITLSTDIAFKLPYNTSEKTLSIPPKVGFNASKLLYFNEYDSKRLNIKTNFKIYAIKIVEKLIVTGYEVVLISHVNGDYKANMELHQLFPQTVLLDKFNNPVEAKNAISMLDILISPRMHSTIAAYSTGVSVIPLSYSRKFRGLYSEIGLEAIVDMEKCNEDQSISLTIQYIKEIKNNRLTDKNKEQIRKRLDVFYTNIEKIIREVSK